MVTPDTLSGWLKAQAWPLGILFLLLAIAFIVLKVSAQRRHAALMQARSGVTEESFVHHLSQYDFDPFITGSTFRYMQTVQMIPFPILPGDKLDEDLGLDSEDVEQTVSELLVILNRREAPGLRYLPMITVEDLVRHLQAAPRKMDSLAA